MGHNSISIIYFNTECDDGFFGHDCLQPCPQACRDICNKITGHCDCGNLTNVSPRCEICPSNCDSGCHDDFVCTSCKVPFYGDQCTKVCPANCRMKSQQACYQDGTCDTCVTGFYGTNCEKKCASNCLDDLCNKETGNCTCIKGWDGSKCDKVINGT